MAQLLVIREQLKKFISTYEHFVRPISKFLLALITFLMINQKIGYTEKLSNAAVVIILALLCSFLPLNLIVVLAAVLILLHLYTLSLEAFVVVTAVLVLMLLLYFRFSPKDTLLVLFTPICFYLKIPYVIPLSAGLVAAPSSIVSVGCGTVLYYILSFIVTNETLLVGQDKENFLINLRMIIDGIIYNKEMMVVIVAFSLTIVVVSLIRRLSVDYSWSIAIVTGTLLDIVVILVGDLKYNTYISIWGLMLGSLFAVLVVIVIKFFVFNVDYSRTERVQFEDDEYYYYVKAVPKNTVALADKQVKKIKSQGKNSTKSGTRPDKMERTAADDGYLDDEEDVLEYRMRRANASSQKVVTGNKTGTKRIILPDEEEYTMAASSRVRQRDGQGMTDIERAAIAKARANRKNNQ
ncbi:MAG: hypothetical protein ACI4DU_07520 [Lachnospiraceae bacterium]